jgi:hypothetical protein
MHERHSAGLGGVQRVLILYNLREGVLKPDIYDPTINPLYRDMRAHYKAIAMSCRIEDPDRKGKVESSVGHAQKTPLKGQRFETLKEAKAYLDRWGACGAGTRWVLNPGHPANPHKSFSKICAPFAVRLYLRSSWWFSSGQN